jgi:hypothetical protein
MPTYAHITWKVTMLGTMFNGGEQWTTGFWLGNVSGGDIGQSPTEADCQLIANRWKTYFESAGSQTHGSWRTDGVKIALISENGTTTPGATAFYYYPSSIAGIQNANLQAPQVSLVATMTSARARGYASKGRMYLPGVAAAVQNDGRIALANTASIRTGLKTFFDGVNTDFADDYEVVLNSQEVAGIPGHAPLMVPVTAVKVGNVYDTQRRRRNQLVEIYETSALA